MSMGIDKKWIPAGVVLAIGLVLAAGWGWYRGTVGPLGEQEQEALRDAEDFAGRIENAQRTITEIKANDEEAERVRRELDRLYRELLAGSAMFSMPPLVREHFARFGIPIRLVRMNSTKDEPDIPGHERSFWSVALPIDEGGRNIFKMLLAVADLDQEKPFLRVIDFAIRPDPENPTARMASMNVSVLNRK